MLFEPIGIVKSPVKEPVDQGWGTVVSEIQVRKELASGLEGLQYFSHVVIIFLMHQSSFDMTSDLNRRPRGQVDVPKVGIFAQRARHRPNPIGVTAVRVLDVRDAVLTVEGLDAIDGTPVLDIKPYVPAFDLVRNSSVPDWIEQLMAGYF